MGSNPTSGTRLRSRPSGEKEACHGVAASEVGPPIQDQLTVENYVLASPPSQIDKCGSVHDGTHRSAPIAPIHPSRPSAQRRRPHAAASRRVVSRAGRTSSRQSQPINPTSHSPIHPVMATSAAASRRVQAEMLCGETAVKIMIRARSVPYRI